MKEQRGAIMFSKRSAHDAHGTTGASDTSTRSGSSNAPLSDCVLKKPSASSSSGTPEMQRENQEPAGTIRMLSYSSTTGNNCKKKPRPLFSLPPAQEEEEEEEERDNDNHNHNHNHNNKGTQNNTNDEAIINITTQTMPANTLTITPMHMHMNMNKHNKPPPRPLNPYNRFFRQERARLMGFASAEEMGLSSTHSEADVAARRKHRRNKGTTGKDDHAGTTGMTFAELARHVGQKFKSSEDQGGIDAMTKLRYTVEYKAFLIQFKHDMELYNKYNAAAAKKKKKTDVEEHHEEEENNNNDKGKTTAVAEQETLELLHQHQSNSKEGHDDGDEQTKVSEDEYESSEEGGNHKENHECCLPKEHHDREPQEDKNNNEAKKIAAHFKEKMDQQLAASSKEQKDNIDSSMPARGGNNIKANNKLLLPVYSNSNSNSHHGGSTNNGSSSISIHEKVVPKRRHRKKEKNQKVQRGTTKWSPIKHQALPLQNTINAITNTLFDCNEEMTEKEDHHHDSSHAVRAGASRPADMHHHNLMHASRKHKCSGETRQNGPRIPPRTTMAHNDDLYLSCPPNSITPQSHMGVWPFSGSDALPSTSSSSRRRYSTRVHLKHHDQLLPLFQRQQRGVRRLNTAPPPNNQHQYRSSLAAASASATVSHLGDDRHDDGGEKETYTTSRYWHCPGQYTTHRHNDTERGVLFGRQGAYGNSNLPEQEEQDHHYHGARRDHHNTEHGCTMNNKEQGGTGGATSWYPDVMMADGTLTPKHAYGGYCSMFDMDKPSAHSYPPPGQHHLNQPYSVAAEGNSNNDAQHGINLAAVVVRQDRKSLILQQLCSSTTDIDEHVRSGTSTSGARESSLLSIKTFAQESAAVALAMARNKQKRQQQLQLDDDNDKKQQHQNGNVRVHQMRSPSRRSLRYYQDDDGVKTFF
jgi:hypothetical protein